MVSVLSGILVVGAGPKTAEPKVYALGLVVAADGGRARLARATPAVGRGAGFNTESVDRDDVCPKRLATGGAGLRAVSTVLVEVGTGGWG